MLPSSPNTDLVISHKVLAVSAVIIIIIITIIIIIIIIIINGNNF